MEQQQHRATPRTSVASSTSNNTHPPMILSQFFMADVIEGDWAIYRLADFLNPELAEGPPNLYACVSEDDARRLMERLDALYLQAIERSAKVVSA